MDQALSWGVNNGLDFSATKTFSKTFSKTKPRICPTKARLVICGHTVKLLHRYCILILNNVGELNKALEAYPQLAVVIVKNGFGERRDKVLLIPAGW